MPVCSFCKQNYEFPLGTTVVQKDGRVKYYCSSKCRKNSEMGRLSKKVKWVRKSDVVKEAKAKLEESRKHAAEVKAKAKEAKVKAKEAKPKAKKKK